MIAFCIYPSPPKNIYTPSVFKKTSLTKIAGISYVSSLLKFNRKEEIPFLGKTKRDV